MIPMNREETILAWNAEVSKLKGELAEERQDHRETLEMYRNRRDAYDQIKEENKELLAALQSMTGMFGEAVTRHVMGKAFGELHQEAVKRAKAVLAKYPEVES